MSRSTFYYQLSHDKDDKNHSLMKKIKSIFYKHNGNYGYHRITIALRLQGIKVNHKKVQRLMKKMELFGKTLKKRNRYNSYKGEVGKIAPNHIQRHFTATKPNQKCYTDVTEFKLQNGEKVYLSPILDEYNGEIIAYDVSTCANLNHNMLKQENLQNIILHSDQRWQYQHNAYQRFLKSHGIIQSMSRKGNSLR